MNPLFTIGHSTHDLETFLKLLTQHQIEVIADVRSNPFSRLPWFCRPTLQKALRKIAIQYVFLGTELGARRTEQNCYVGNRADYNLIANTESYHKGIERLKDGTSRFRIALLCSEREPLDCHRAILVCRHAKKFANIFHIGAAGALEPHENAETRLLARYFDGGADFFRHRTDLLEDAYQRRGLEINYVNDMGAASEEKP